VEYSVQTQRSHGESPQRFGGNLAEAEGEAPLPQAACMLLVLH